MIKKQIAFHSTEIEEVYILYQQAFPKNEQMDLTRLFDELHLGALIGPGVAASHGMERTHLQAVENTLKLLLAYIA